MKDTADAVIEALEALVGDDLGGHEAMVIRDLSPPERMRYFRQREVELKKALREVAIQESNRAFHRERRRVGDVMSGLTTLIIAGLTDTMEEAIPFASDRQTGRLTVGAFPVLERGRESCLRSIQIRGDMLLALNQHLERLEHLSPALQAWTAKGDSHCTLCRGTHPVALVSDGIEDVTALGLTPCVCGGKPETHNYQVVDVNLRVGPFVWPPGTYFDSPCPEAEEDLAKFVAAGMVVDLREKPKVPVEVEEPSPQQVLDERLSELGAAEAQVEDDTGGGAE